MTSSQMYFVDLINAMNNCGISRRDNLADGMFNVWGNSYPSDELPDSGAIVKFGEVTFRFPEKETRPVDNVVCVGQSIVLEDGIYFGLSILGAAERRSSDFVSFISSTGAKIDVPVCLSDWWSSSRGYFRNTLAVRCSCMHYPRHVQNNVFPALWIHHVALPNISTSLLVLPDNPALHIFALTLERRIA